MRYRVFRDAFEMIPPGPVPAGARALQPTESEWEWRGTGDAVDEKAVESCLSDAVRRKGSASLAEFDIEAALLLRSSLRIGRRDASDVDLWTFLNRTVGWNYVTRRWAGKEDAVGRRRIAGNLDRSALGRLWWMAELCAGAPGNPKIPESELRARLALLLNNQDIAVQLYERPRLLRRPGMPGPLLELAALDWTEDGFRAFAKRAYGQFGVRLTAAQSSTEVASELRNCVQEDD